MSYKIIEKNHLDVTRIIRMQQTWNDEAEGKGQDVVRIQKMRNNDAMLETKVHLGFEYTMSIFKEVGEDLQNC